MTTQIKVRDLEIGMKIKDGRALRTVVDIHRNRIEGYGEFPDYEMFVVFVDGPRSYGGPRGMVPAHAEYDPDETITVYA